MVSRKSMLLSTNLEANKWHPSLLVNGFKKKKVRPREAKLVEMLWILAMRLGRQGLNIQLGFKVGINKERLSLSHFRKVRETEATEGKD